MEKTKSMRQLQNEVDQYITSFKEGYFPPMELIARLTEELGELSREVQHHYGMKKKKNTEEMSSLAEETGDLLFVLICFANSQGIQLDDALDTVLQKFNKRDANRWTKKEEQ